MSTESDMNRRAFDNERWTRIEVTLAELTLHTKACKPVMEQVLHNKEDILVLKTNASNIKDNKGRLIAYAALGSSLIMTVLTYLRFHKPH